MLVSYNWLQTYFKEKLPEISQIEEAFTFHAFEIEGIEEKTIGTTKDFIFDVKVLPDRMNYALSHRGIAYELSAILNMNRTIPLVKDFEVTTTKPLTVEIKEPDFCFRYIGKRIEHIKVGESPLWLKERLESVGQRSINNIVDSANFVMLDTGQPLHIFDADKVVGNISVRFAKEGERITTLEGKEVDLDPRILVIADEEAPLAIAGIKGGKKAEVTDTTCNLIIESAHFDPSLIRRTSAKVGIKNDSSKRYENGITSELAPIGMGEVCFLIKEMNEGALIGKNVDVYVNKKERRVITLNPTDISEILGVVLSREEIIDILTKLDILVEEKNKELVLTIPYARLDLVLVEDIIEEVGRLYGYDKIPTSRLGDSVFKPVINKKFYWSSRIADFLLNKGFSEVFSYSLTSSGYFEIEKSVASDKNFARPDLAQGLIKSLELNTHNAPLLGLEKICIFEIGNVFPAEGEHTALGIAIGHTRKIKGQSAQDEISSLWKELSQELSLQDETLSHNKDLVKINSVAGILECNFDKLLELLKEPVSLFETDKEYHEAWSKIKRYKTISSYPFMLRDIAVFLEGEKGREHEVLEVIKEAGTTLLVRADLFDIFTKTFEDKVKTSYAYRLVFQSEMKTLSDEEINPIMETITHKMREKGWEVR